MKLVALLPPLLVVCGIAYNILAIRARRVFAERKQDHLPYSPPVSILKPVRGKDSGFYEAIRSHAVQKYPKFEIVFGVADPEDPAVHDIEQLYREFPDVPIRMVNTANDAPNGKVGSLEILAREAKFRLYVVNDSDIVVEPDYLERIIAPLGDPDVGMVTCLYRGKGSSLATKTEALGIATEFLPSVLVAHMLGEGGFALGATMAFRSSGLADVGGFAAIREYLADDYQLGARIAKLKEQIVLSDVIVETNLGSGSWLSVWKHQVRWSRTIRVSRPSGYYGYLLTQLSFWCLVAAATGWWKTAIAGILVRLVTARTYSPSGFLFVPLRDLFGALVWFGGLGGRYVEWRGIKFRLLRDGRMRAV